ncbi:MAG: class I SAM-dependent methyltransferase [Endomicrobiales bacterium]|nr:class I SAM-dependent methyltransferase [Endomicrobiales bacterium]
MDIEFTGEYFLLGKTPKRIEEDHLSRYSFVRDIVKGKKVLDIACGTGYGSKMIAEYGASSVDGMDINPANIEYAKDKYRHPCVNFALGDICAIGSENKYDVIVSFETIEHVPDYKKALHSIFESAVQGGLLVVSSPNRMVTSSGLRSLEGKPYNRHHLREFTCEELSRELTNAGFEVDPGSYYGQRQRPLIRNKYIRYLYNKVFKPDEKTDPSVKPVRNLEPRYFVLIAKKPMKAAK